MNLKFFGTSLLSLGIRYGTAFLLPAAALGLTLLIWTFIKPLASPLFLTAIMITAWQSGLRAGILATLLSGFIIDYFFITPQYKLSGDFDILFDCLFSRLKAAFCLG